MCRMHDPVEVSIEEEGDLATIIYYPEWLDAQKVMEEIQNDPFMGGIVAELQQGNQSKLGFSFCNGVLC